MRYDGQQKQLYGGEKNTTNNRMEMLAAIRALESLQRRCRIALTTDSTYLKNGITAWMSRWKKNGWKTSARKAVKNVDLWQQLDILSQQHDIQWHWVRGHTGHPENELADALANRGIDELRAMG